MTSPVSQEAKSLARNTAASAEKRGETPGQVIGEPHADARR
jgi:hypothetical protein